VVPEIVLFWVVAAGFLVADNLRLIPAGGDYLRFGRRGRLRYEPGARLEARGRDLIFLNPLNLFHRAALTSSVLGRLEPRQLRAARQRLRKAVPTLNLLSWLGTLYLVLAVALASQSMRFSFAVVLASFLAVHLVFWALSAGVLVWRRNKLGFTGAQLAVFVAEGFFVPAYTINLGKRLWFKCTLELPAMTVGLRQGRLLRDEHARELFTHQMGQRLDLLETALPDGDPPALRPLINEARACLTT
jgi:hypothetical protein